jgi:hypothetical protein
MKEENRAFSWKKIAEIQHEDKTRLWNHKPKFRIGEIVLVKPKAQDIHRTDGKKDSSWGTLVAGFDKCREPLRGRQCVIIEITNDKEYGCSYYVLFGSKRSGKTPYKTVMMCEQWLKKRTGGGDEPFIADLQSQRDNEDKKIKAVKHCNRCHGKGYAIDFSSTSLDKEMCGCVTNQIRVVEDLNADFLKPCKKKDRKVKK